MRDKAVHVEVWCVWVPRGTVGLVAGAHALQRSGARSPFKPSGFSRRLTGARRRSGRSWLPGSAWPRGAPGEGGVAPQNHDNGRLRATSAEILLSGRARCAIGVAWRTRLDARVCKWCAVKGRGRRTWSSHEIGCERSLLKLLAGVRVARAWRNGFRVFLPEASTHNYSEETGGFKRGRGFRADRTPGGVHVVQARAAQGTHGHCKAPSKQNTTNKPE